MEKQLDPVIEIQHLKRGAICFSWRKWSRQEYHDLDYLRAAEKGQWRGKDRRQRSRSEAGRH